MSRRPSNLSAAWTAGRLAARRLFRNEANDRDVALAEQLTGRLDEMKGLAMKLGQIVSYMDVPLPDEVVERLAALQTGTRGRPLAELRGVVQDSLGLPLEEAFDEIAADPVAAASIGQVHRARWQGRDVAVKIQYPDIEGTFSSDLRGVQRLAGLAGLASSVDGRAVVDELAARLAEECDYAAEARHQVVFAAAFADDPELWIPAVIAERSGPRVLTTEWASARPFSTFRDQASRIEKNAAAQALVRFSYRSLLVFGTIQADPHPGNFAFTEDGRVVCFDFGCVRALPPTLVGAQRELMEGLLADDPPAVRRAAEALGVVGQPRRFDHAHYYAMMRHLHRPFWDDGFHFTSEFVREGMAFNGPSSPNARYLAMPPAYVWVARLQWGLWSVLARLGADGGFGEVARQLLDTHPAPLP